MRTSLTLTVLGAGLVATVVLTRFVTRAIERAEDERQEQAALRRMDQYCSEMKTTLEGDAKDLASTEPELQSAAAARLRGVVALQTWRDVQFCAPQSSRGLATCGGWKDAPCLSHLVRSAAAEIGTSDAEPGALGRLRERCFMVKDYVGLAASGIEHAELRDDVLETFGSGVSFTSVPEIRMCSPIEPDLGRLDECRRNRDYVCVRDVIGEALWRVRAPGDP